MIRSQFLGGLVFSVSIQFGPLHNSAHGHSDVFLAATGGQVAVGGANELGTINENFDLTARVFEGVMVSSFPPFNPADYGRDEPGFEALVSGSAAFPVGAAALPANTGVTINRRPFSVGTKVDTLFFWNGSGAVDFQPIATVQPGVELALDTNPIGTTSASGALHEHPVFTIDNGGAGVPLDGVYLIAPTATVAGLTDSQPVYMVWLVDALLDDEDAAEGLEASLEQGQTVYLGKDFAFFEQAVDYVQNLLVPEPTSGLLSLLAFAGVIASARMRKRGRR